MKNILLSCIKWLRFTGLLRTADIGSAPASEHKTRKLVNIAADLRLLWLILLFVIILATKVMLNKFL